MKELAHYELGKNVMENPTMSGKGYSTGVNKYAVNFSD